MKIVFIHGWASDASIWSALAAHLEDTETHFVELGFTGKPVETALPDEKALYVTHSLGTMWALKHAAAERIGGLVAINGFTCFKDFAPDGALAAMKAGLQKNPRAQVRSFCKMADMPVPDAMDTARLREGLGWLADWDMRAQAAKIKGPVSALAGAQDRIVPKEASLTQWVGANLYERYGHNLPLANPEACKLYINRCREVG